MSGITSERLEALDNALKGFSQVTKKKLLMRLAQLGVQDRVRIAKKINKAGEEVKDKPLRKSVKAGLRKKGGEIEKVFFSFPRTGIFIEHGVGRSRPVNSSRAQKYAKKWLSVEIPEAIDELADLLEEQYADLVVGELRIIVPGVLDTQTRKLD